MPVVPTSPLQLEIMDNPDPDKAYPMALEAFK